MSALSKILIGIIAFEHLYILWVEMFAWTTVGKKMFKSLPEHLFESTKGLAANQGLYNGFLAAGLIWSLLIGDASWASHISTFFLGCVVTAGVYGGLTASKSILIKQASPALIVLVITLILK